MATGGIAGVEVTVETPDAGLVAAIENSLRQAQGVTGTIITSLSLGGLSRMQINYDGDFAMLRWALDQEGWRLDRSEEHTSELQSLMRISYADFCLKKKK